MKTMVARFDQIEPVPCPCGMSRRAFVTPDNPTATIHMVDISEDARAHYHKKLTEIYLILEGEGFRQKSISSPHSKNAGVTSWPPPGMILTSIGPPSAS